MSFMYDFLTTKNESILFNPLIRKFARSLAEKLEICYSFWGFFFLNTNFKLSKCQRRWTKLRISFWIFITEFQLYVQIGYCCGLLLSCRYLFRRFSFVVHWLLIFFFVSLLRSAVYGYARHMRLLFCKCSQKEREKVCV